MPRPPNLIPTSKLRVAIQQPLRDRLDAMLWSDLECRVPVGAYQKWIEGRLIEYLSHKVLDLSPFTGEPHGLHFVSGPPETIMLLRSLLERNSHHEHQPPHPSE